MLTVVLLGTLAAGAWAEPELPEVDKDGLHLVSDAKLGTRLFSNLTLSQC